MKAPTPWAVASNLTNGMNCQLDFPTSQHSWTLWSALLIAGQRAVTSKIQRSLEEGVVALFQKDVEDNLGGDWDYR